MTQIYRTWKQRIESGSLSHALCRQWAQAVIPIANGEMSSGKRTNLTRDEATDLLDLMPSSGLRLDPSHSALGLEWLQRYGTDLIGIPAEVIRDFERFTFHGEAMKVQTETGWRTQHYPIWRIHTTDGQTVDYFCGPWQIIAYGGKGSERKSRGAWRMTRPLYASMWRTCDDEVPVVVTT
jgi:hypothetical protein